MKTAVAIVIALLAGLVLGSWSLKTDLRRAEKEISDLKQELSRRPAARQTGLSGITSMLKIPESDGGPASHREPPRRAVAAAPTNAPAATNAEFSIVFGTDTNAVARHRHGPRHDDFRRQLETAANAWKVRSDLARAGFVTNVASNDDQGIQFDVTMAAMNMRLSNSVRTWVDFVKQQEEVTPETGIKMMNDLSASLVQAYNDLDRTMPADWRAKAGPKFQVFDFVNPEVIMPLTEVEDAFRRSDNANAGTNAVGHSAP